LEATTAPPGWVTAHSFFKLLATASWSSGSQPQYKTPSSDSRPKYPPASASGRPKVVCFYCNTPGHVLSNCRKRIAKMSGKSTEEAPIQLLSTVPRTPDVTIDVKTSVKQKEPVLDPRFEQHCTSAQLVRPDSSVMHVRLLRDTGAHHSLVCSCVLTDTDYTPTGEFHLFLASLEMLSEYPWSRLLCHVPCAKEPSFAD